MSPALGASQVALVVKNPSANAGDIRDVGSIPGWGRCPGGGHGSPLQSSCLENPMDRGAWWATVHEFAKSWRRLSTHTQSCRWKGLYKCFEYSLSSSSLFVCFDTGEARGSVSCTVSSIPGMHAFSVLSLFGHIQYAKHGAR